MNNLPLFIAGCFVTLLVTVAGGALIYAAILDGRYQKEMDERQRQAVEPGGD